MAFGTVKWRERAFREVRDELDRFLNYPVNEKIELGDFGVYDGRRCRFDWEGNLKGLGIPVASAGVQNEIVEVYATAGAVKVQEKLHFSGFNPSASITFDRKTALAFRAHKIGLDKVQLSALETSLSTAVNKGLAWNTDRVIITQLWQADGFTQLVSGSSKAGIEIEATLPGVGTGFNYADPSVGLKVVNHQWMSYHAVGIASVRPYFTIHKLRQDMAGNWKLFKYGLRN
jgi:hypothetical protein